jgi:hypothetical protein
MADIDYEDGAVARLAGAQVQRIVQMAGALCSVALIAGLALWGYRLAVRDVTGIPVIRAVEGPMRVAPSNPGGDIADHQGLAINAVAAVGGATDLPPEIVLAPPPMELAPDDPPGLTALDAVPPAAAVEATVAPLIGIDPQSVAPVVTVPAPLLEALVPEVLPEPVVAPPPAEPVSTQDAVALALAEALGADLETLGLTQDAPAEGALVSAGPTTTIRPMRRPQSLAAAQPETVFAETPVDVAPSSPELDPDSLPAGTRLVQLGAFDSPEVARGEWATLQARFGDLMSGKSVVIQAAQSGGRTFYRLRAHGFDGEDDARRFCAALLAENAACIPVVHR